jgi:hypothetical protein
MKELKDHLRSLKRDYQSVSYPGDLSAEVPLRSGGWGWRIGGPLALAAVVALGMTIWVATSNHSDEPTIVKSDVKPTPERVAVVTPPQVEAESDELPAWTSIGSTPMMAQATPSSTDSAATGVTPTTVPSLAPSTTSFPEVQSASMPYQSLSFPTVSEIDQHLQSQGT